MPSALPHQPSAHPLTRSGRQRRPFARSLMPWLTLAATLAAAPALTAAETVHWPVPWKAGQTWDYRHDTLQIEISEGAREELRVTADTTITLEDEAQALLQVWRERDTRVETVEGDRTTADLMASVLGELEDLPLKLRLRADGRIAGLANLEEAHARLRAAMQRVVETSVDAMLQDAMLQNEDEALPEEQRETMREMLSAMLTAKMDDLVSRESVEPMLTAVLDDFNGFTGRDYRPGRVERERSTLETPLSGRALPAQREYRLHLNPATPDNAILTWTDTLDLRAADPDALWVMAAEITGDESLVGSEGRPRGLSVVVEGQIDWRRNDGAILAVERLRTARYGDAYTGQLRDRYSLQTGPNATPSP